MKGKYSFLIITTNTHYPYYKSYRVFQHECAALEFADASLHGALRTVTILLHGVSEGGAMHPHDYRTRKEQFS